MTLSTLLNLPCTIERRQETSGTDAYGNTVITTVEVDTVCELQQVKRDEPGDQAETSATQWLLVLPAGTAIDTSDRVIVDPHVYEVTGDPWQARNPRTQAQSHVEATVVRTGTEVGS